MFSTLTLFNSNEVKLRAGSKNKQIKKSSKNKAQARKNQTREAVEIVWLKQFVTKKVATVLFILALITTIPFLLPTEDIFPVEKIRLSGDFKQLDTAKLEKELEPYLGTGFFSVDIKSVQRIISLEPWIQTVSVKRIWPDLISISIKEKNAFARWDNEHQLSSRAEIFRADSQLFPGLPMINGYSGQSSDLLQRYHSMSKAFASYGISITEMTEDSKGALRLLLNNQLKVNIGSENSEQKIKHLLAVYQQQIKPRADQIKHIDFRYSNGFAIAWKDEYLDKSANKAERGNKNV